MAVLLAGGALFTIAFFAFVSPPGRKPWPPGPAARTILARLGAERPFLLIAALVLVGHLVQVNLVGPRAREWWLETSGVDFAGVLYAIEGDLVASLSALHWGPLLFATYWFYLVLHFVIILIAPLFLAHLGERILVRRLLLSYGVLWLVAQLGFFLFPADNPTVHLGLPSALEKVIPGSDAVFYRGTTISNTVPSLHVGFATLIMLHGSHSANRRLRLTLYVYAPGVVLSILYLQTHWALDALAGALAALIAYAIGTRLEPRFPPSRPQRADA